MMRPAALALLAFVAMAGFNAALAENLYREHTQPGLATDQRAAQVGDIVTVIVYQNAEARNAAQNTSRKRHNFEGAFQAGSIDESADLTLDGAYQGQGEIRRSESFITQISVVIESIRDNGDYVIAGEQEMFINGERTNVRIHGLVRPTDINANNQVLSTRIADAEISYSGHGFVSRNASPGIIQHLFSWLGLGG